MKVQRALLFVACLLLVVIDVVVAVLVVPAFY